MARDAPLPGWLRVFGTGLLLLVVADRSILAARPAEAALRDGFETPEPAWIDTGGDARYRIETQERTRAGCHSGDGCEYVQLQMVGTARNALLRYTLGRAPVIAETKASLWVRADRPGTQIMARVVLPRATDPATHQPISILLAGTAYTEVNTWQQLRLDDVATLVSRQAWVLRAQQRTEIDTREAFIDCLLLNVYSGPGRLALWIDDLEVDGIVDASAPATGPPVAAASSSGATLERQRRATVEFNGSVLLVEGRPFFPRAIEHHGEPLRWLRERGFNAVKLTAPPSDAMLTEAERAGIWLVCPPPPLGGAARAPGAVDRPANIPAKYDRVIAWDLGSGLAAGDQDATKRVGDQVRAADPYTARPTLCAPEEELHAYSRRADILMLDREPLGTTFELNDYGTWVRERSRLMRPGTPTWVTIQTELAPELREQFKLLSGDARCDAGVDSDQMRGLVYTALATGARGLLFRSHARLDADDAWTRMRASSLELLNLELELLEPWTAVGSHVTNITSSNYAPPKPPPPGTAGLRTGDKRQLLNPQQPVNAEVNGFVLHTGRARLLLPIWSGGGSQFVTSQWAGNYLSFVIPGVPEATDVYEVTSSGLRPPFKKHRVTGGIRVTLDEFGMADTVVLTQDPLALGTLSRRAAELSRRSTELERGFVAGELRYVTENENRLAVMGHTTIKTNEWLAAANAALARSDERMAANDLAAAYLEARRARRPLQRIERAQWEEGIKPLFSPLADPLATTYVTLAEHHRFMATVNEERWGLNLLPAGDFEDIQAMQSSGWQHLQNPRAGINSEVELSSQAKRGGRTSLRIAARSAGEEPMTGIIETPPVWVVSAPVEVRAGQWVRIRGWVFVPSAITASLDGLMIYDSQNGTALAERVGQADAWRQFTMVRAMPRSGSVSVVFSMTGLGEAWIDNVMIEPLLPTGTTRSMELRRRGLLVERLPTAVPQAQSAATSSSR
ncbi:MAG TPA: hypothetical protein VHZ24_11995 [Pirellulales bacterium]|jgi:hypothetical protein|nr:hypothetical protein [Pirellulales bacterium]